jgi:hypothetical protein
MFRGDHIGDVCDWQSLRWIIEIPIEKTWRTWLPTRIMASWPDHDLLQVLGETAHPIHETFSGCSCSVNGVKTLETVSATSAENLEMMNEMNHPWLNLIRFSSHIAIRREHGTDPKICKIKNTFRIWYVDSNSERNLVLFIPGAFRRSAHIHSSMSKLDLTTEWHRSIHCFKSWDKACSTWSTAQLRERARIVK